MVRKITKPQMAKLVENNYGSIYKSSGGGKAQIGGMPVKKFMKKILGNRVFDLYLKYGGIKTLTTATLVPMALILGKDYMENLIKGQVGGSDPIPKNIPILDNPVVGSYLKLVGLSTMKVSLNTLVPLGVVMIAHDLYTSSSENTEKRGSSRAQNKKPRRKSPSQTGGGSSILGSSVPPHLFQNIGSTMTGNTPSILTSSNYNITDVPVSNLQCADGSCGPNIYTSSYNDTGISDKVLIDGMHGVFKTKLVSSKWSGNLRTTDPIVIPSSMAGGGSYSDSYNFIYHPKSKKRFSINSKTGQQILNKYLKNN